MKLTASDWTDWVRPKRDSWVQNTTGQWPFYSILPLPLRGLVQKTPSESNAGPANRKRLPSGPFCTTCTMKMRDGKRKGELHTGHDTTTVSWWKSLCKQYSWSNWNVHWVRLLRRINPSACYLLPRSAATDFSSLINTSAPWWVWSLYILSLVNKNIDLYY